MQSSGWLTRFLDRLKGRKHEEEEALAELERRADTALIETRTAVKKLDEAIARKYG